MVYFVMNMDIYACAKKKKEEVVVYMEIYTIYQNYILLYTRNRPC